MLSVGQAGLATRLMISLVICLSSIIVIAVGVLLSRHPAGVIVAVVLLEPVGLAGVLAAMFIAAPHSAYGSWLDRFVPRLRNPRTAAFVVILLLVAGSALIWIGQASAAAVR